MYEQGHEDQLMVISGTPAQRYMAVGRCVASRLFGAAHVGVIHSIRVQRRCQGGGIEKGNPNFLAASLKLHLATESWTQVHLTAYCESVSCPSCAVVSVQFVKSWVDHTPIQHFNAAGQVRSLRRCRMLRL